MGLAASQERPGARRVRAFQLPHPVHQRLRPCLRTSARQSAQSPSRNFSTHRPAPSVSAASVRTPSRGRVPVTARAATDGSAAAVKKPPSLLRRRESTDASVARAERGSRARRSSSSAVTVPSAASTSRAESDRTRYSTVAGDQRATTTVACGVRG